jgi:biopolymer transport protein ExbD
MTNKVKNTKIIIVLLLGMMALTPACKTSEKVPKEEKQAEKAERQQQKEDEKQYELAVKHHHEIQSDQTKKSMRALKKQQRKLNRSKKRSVWDQLFNNKCDKPVDTEQ